MTAPGGIFAVDMAETKTSLHEYFERFPDYRVNWNKRHLLVDIIILSILAVLCGAESWDAIESYGKTKHGFLKNFLKLSNGIPSHDTINRFFSNLRPKLFEKMFVEWVSGLKNAEINKKVNKHRGQDHKGFKRQFPWTVSHSYG
ncbi:ISAs1 family transposase [Sphingobacterium thalpophilum]|uniref:ISAs1 family transposase n=2 Tax=Sphingobacterium TaxID=28453 RepID=A0ACD5C7T6_9SPHI